LTVDLDSSVDERASQLRVNYY